jgi:hypothetical protein
MAMTIVEAPVGITGGVDTHYFDRRVKEGRTKRDVIRILQRYIAREVCRYLPRG